MMSIESNYTTVVYLSSHNRNFIVPIKHDLAGPIYFLGPLSNLENFYFNKFRLGN